MNFPIHQAALDDRLGFVGTAGSGKTYGAGVCVEKLLHAGSRCVIVDPLDVWWGLRLAADGKSASSFNVVIFGGAHGDLPLTEHAGALIGETVARAAESCIISLGSLGTKASERRFMLAFLTALYRAVDGEPLHLVMDEADMWAPQRLMDKDGEAAKLLGQMETIVRRGRVKGFLPWLITQRPAVISKDVLSQVDGLVAFKLTSSQDRDALGGWIEGQADRQQGKEILASLPALPRGRGVVWIPGRAILETADFPVKATFDSSRTPKRGEKKLSAVLKPIDVEKLRGRLATVQAQVQENDPKHLRAKIAELTKQLAAKVAAAPAAPADDRALHRAVEAARKEGFDAGVSAARGAMADELGRHLGPIAERLTELPGKIGAAPALGRLKPVAPYVDPATVPLRVEGPAPAPRAPAATGGDTSLPGPQKRILDALAWWESARVPAPSKVQIAAVANYSPGGGAFMNPLGSLRTAGLIEYPSPGRVTLTAAGRTAAAWPAETPTTEALHAKVMAILDGPKRRILAPLLEAYPDDMSREELAKAAAYEPRGGAFMNPLGALRSLGLVEYPTAKRVVALPILFIA